MDKDEEKVELPETEPEETETEDAHPLEPGGERFKQVYGDMKDAKREAEALKAELAALRAQVPKVAEPPPTPQPQFYTVTQLEAMVKAGTVTLEQAQEHLEWQREQKLLQTIEKKNAEREILTSANREVDEYLKVVPGLNDPSSKAFRDVASASQEIAAETGLNIRDPRVIKRALRETLGRIETVKQRYQDREQERRGSSAPTDIGDRRGNGGDKKDTKDILKTVPQMYLDHWKRLNYTPDQMREEAKYVSVRPRRG